MQIIIKIIGLFCILEGFLYFIEPNILKRVIGFFGYNRRFYFIGAVNLIIGIFFLATASQATWSWLIIVIGSMFVIASAFSLIQKSAEWEEIISWCQQQPSVNLRMVAAIGMIIGLGIVFAA